MFFYLFKSKKICKVLVTTLKKDTNTTERVISSVSLPYFPAVYHTIMMNWV